MTIKQVIHYQPWLRLIDINKITTRLSKYTNGDIFVAYNTLTSQYELHSINSFKLTGYSQNAVIEEDMLNNFLYQDFRSTEHRKFAQEVEDSRFITNKLYENAEKNRYKRLQDQLRLIERTIGTKV